MTESQLEPGVKTPVTVLGTPLQCTTYEHFISFCQWRCKQPGVVAVDMSNTHIVTLRRHDAHFRKVTEHFDYFVPDGMPLIWTMNARGAKLKDRVYGPTFMRRCITASPRPFTHYFLGGSQQCVDKLIAFFRRENPNVEIVGSHHGYFSSDKDQEIVDEINRLSPDFIWVGIGTPKQQEWIYRHKSAFQRGILLAVGFAFDVNAGTKKDAPLWMQKVGLTWLFRVMKEPRRLAMRYFRFNSLFLWYLLGERTKAENRTVPALARSASSPPRVNVLGVGISEINRKSGLELALEAVKERARGYICVTSVHGVMEAQQDAKLRDTLNHAFLCTPDGMPMVWMGKLQGHKSIGRVYGPDLMLDVCQATAGTGIRHFFYGGHGGVTEELKRKLSERFPGLNVVGTYEPPFRPLHPEEAEALCKEVEQCRPDIFWVGLSTPKQERFMADYIGKLNVTLMAGVGAAFDFHTGRVKQAPRWMQDAGLEWFYRLCQEPRRLTPRYLKNNPPFLLLAILQLLRLKRYSLEKSRMESATPVP